MSASCCSCHLALKKLGSEYFAESGRSTSGGSSAYVVVSLVASLMVLWRHRSNIERLLAGTEPKIGQKS